MDANRMLERELDQIQQMQELDQEELQEEEVDSDESQEEEFDSLYNSSEDDDINYRVSGAEIAFNSTLAPLHNCPGEVEDRGSQQHKISFLDGGAIFNVPLFYLEGDVLFPGATLPLRIIESNFITTVEKAMGPPDAPYTIGVLRIRRDLTNGSLKFANVGTTAEIRQYRYLEDGSVNVVTRGKQRFRVRRRWIDVDGAPCGEVQIIQEDLPFRTPKDAFGALTPSCNLRGSTLVHLRTAHSKSHGQHGNSGTDSVGSFESEPSMTAMELHQAAIRSWCRPDVFDAPFNIEDEGTESSKKTRSSLNANKRKKDWMTGQSKKSREVGRAFSPHWVYQMYDSFHLAKRAADLWKHIVGIPSMDAYVKKPDSLSFQIASKIPVSESTKQELLEIDGVPYRLRREIELLESFDDVRCKNCKTLFGRRSDMLVMSSEGPVSLFTPHGFVHGTITLLKAKGLSLVGLPDSRYSWFPGYALTIANCTRCGSYIGWLFTATNKKLKPEAFWGIRSCQVADDTDTP